MEEHDAIKGINIPSWKPYQPRKEKERKRKRRDLATSIAMWCTRVLLVVPRIDLHAMIGRGMYCHRWHMLLDMWHGSGTLRLGLGLLVVHWICIRGGGLSLGLLLLLYGMTTVGVGEVEGGRGHGAGCAHTVGTCVGGVGKVWMGEGFGCRDAIGGVEFEKFLEEIESVWRGFWNDG